MVRKRCQYSIIITQANVMVSLSSKPDGGYILNIIGKNSKSNSKHTLKRIPKPMADAEGGSFSMMLKGNLIKFELLDPNVSFDLLVGMSFFLLMIPIQGLNQNTRNSTRMDEIHGNLLSQPNSSQSYLK
jgi:hypothetical protein